jgi:hypothetical protein
LDHNPSIYACHVPWFRHVPSHQANFLPGWPWTMIFPKSWDYRHASPRLAQVESFNPDLVSFRLRLLILTMNTYLLRICIQPLPHSIILRHHLPQKTCSSNTEPHFYLQWSWDQKKSWDHVLSSHQFLWF